MPIVRPSRNRAPIRVGTENARADSSENAAKVAATSTIDRLRPIRLASAPPPTAPSTSPMTTAVVTSCCWPVERPNSSVMKSSAPAMFDES